MSAVVRPRFYPLFAIALAAVVFAGFAHRSVGARGPVDRQPVGW